MKHFLMVKWAFLACLLSSSLACAAAVKAPEPYGAVPSKQQLAWADMEMYAFVHFTLNTFTDKEWGNGDENPNVFNPTDFSADQIVGTLADAGFQGVILTAKHHDGFCLWPTKTTEHNISKSPWKNGKGDMVKEFSDACKKRGVKFGIYLSPWDRNSATYGKPEYIKLYREQLRELLTQYGPIFETWFDGANGGTGYYGGARENRKIDSDTYYDWPNTWKLIRELQPNTVIWGDDSADVRWIGNEGGSAPYPCWSTVNIKPNTKGPTAHPRLDRSKLGSGTMDGTDWCPGETNTSIRPGWFYHASENGRVRSSAKLLDIYFQSVGHGTPLLLNLPPDRRGRAHETDVQSLQGFKKALDEMYAVNFATGARVSADAERGPEFAAANVLKKSATAYWATPDNITTASLTLDLPQAKTFDTIRLAEAIQLGQRVRKFVVDVRGEDGTWQEWIKNGSSIGMHTLLRGKAVTTNGVRLRILKSAASPCIREVSLYQVPVVASNKPAAGTADPSILSKDKWKITCSFETTDHPASLLIDNNPETFWNTHDSQKGEQAPPQWVMIDLGAEQSIAAVTALPRQGTAVSVVDRYRLEWSLDGKTWSAPLEGEFSNIRANPIEQRINVPDKTRARYIRFTALHVLEKSHVSLAEIGVIKAAQ